MAALGQMPEVVGGREFVVRDLKRVQDGQAG